MKPISFSDRCCLTEAARAGRKTMFRSIARYDVGDVLAIRESYETIFDRIRTKDGSMEATQFVVSVLEAHGLDTNDVTAVKHLPGWRDKRRTKADLMTSHIIITACKEESLQDISDEDCMKEGIMEGVFSNTRDRFYFDLQGDETTHLTYPTAHEAFKGLVCHCRKGCDWARNPRVYAYTFKYIKA